MSATPPMAEIEMTRNAEEMTDEDGLLLLLLSLLRLLKQVFVVPVLLLPDDRHRGAVRNATVHPTRP